MAWGVFGLARHFLAGHPVVRGKPGYGITVVEVNMDYKF